MNYDRVLLLSGRKIMKGDKILDFQEHSERFEAERLANERVQNDLQKNKESTMTEKTQATKELEEKLKYRRAVYRFHECDDPALKEHFQSIIRNYEKKHGKPVRIPLPVIKEFDGRGLA